MAGTSGMKDSVGKGDHKQRPDRGAIGLGRADGRGDLAIELRLPGEQPADDAADLRFGWRPRSAERRLRHDRVDGAVGCENKDRKSTRLNSSHMSISYAVF